MSGWGDMLGRAVHSNGHTRAWARSVGMDEGDGEAAGKGAHGDGKCVRGRGGVRWSGAAWWATDWEKFDDCSIWIWPHMRVNKDTCVTLPRHPAISSQLLQRSCYFAWWLVEAARVHARRGAPVWYGVRASACRGTGQ